MFLYENNDKFIDVYKLVPKLEDITKYKISEMEKIYNGEKVWRASTNGNVILEDNCDTICAKELNKCINDIYGTDYHDFRTVDNEEANKFLNLYFNDVNSKRFYKIKNSGDNLRYIILLNQYYSVINYPTREFVMNGIISVPRSLYLLEVFLNERFDLLKNDEIDNLLKLFDIMHYGRINTEVLRNICDYEILSDTYDSIIGKTGNNENVLNKVKKLAK